MRPSELWRFFMGKSIQTYLYIVSPHWFLKLSQLKSNKCLNPTQEEKHFYVENKSFYNIQVSRIHSWCMDCFICVKSQPNWWIKYWTSSLCKRTSCFITYFRDEIWPMWALVEFLIFTVIMQCFILWWGRFGQNKYGCLHEFQRIWEQILDLIYDIYL